MMEEKFIISGGIPRKFGELMAAGHVLKKAEIAEIDFDKKQYFPKLTYETPAEYCTDKQPSIGFTSFSVSDEYIYIGTTTEILKLNSKTYEIESILNDRLFNDVHHVKKVNDKYYVVNTGMDALFEFDKDFNRVDIYNCLNKDPFYRFNENENLNKIASTKPHQCHPNHVFTINGEVWVTRFKQKDAICIHDFTKRIDIGLGFPHDGFVKGNLVYFTTVNGYVLAFNTKTYKKEIEIKLGGQNSNKTAVLGWCRGLYVDEDCFYVGFTQLRTTKVTENLAWLKTMIKEKKIIDKPEASRIEKYSLDGTYLDKYELPSDGIFTIFGIEKI